MTTAQSCDPGCILGRDDVEVIQAALLALPPTSPKRIGQMARLERLHKMLAVPLPRLPGTGRGRDKTQTA